MLRLRLCLYVRTCVSMYVRTCVLYCTRIAGHWRAVSTYVYSMVHAFFSHPFLTTCGVGSQALSAQFFSACSGVCVCVCVCVLLVDCCSDFTSSPFLSPHSAFRMRSIKACCCSLRCLTMNRSQTMRRYSKGFTRSNWSSNILCMPLFLPLCMRARACVCVCVCVCVRVCIP